ncbi:MAG: type II toxin-antitoxin system prevent-host-death family antitoxin [Chitinivibrionales bacterium]|nr:type II toxin-antitoxin system prevent-host-death family antitoxin [Chitinivibrionales bacterium]
MSHLAVKEARRDFADLLNRVAYGGERVLIDRHGKPVAALVSVEDLALLEELENSDDAKVARKRLAAERAKAVPYEQARRELGLS